MKIIIIILISILSINITQAEHNTIQCYMSSIPEWNNLNLTDNTLSSSSVSVEYICQLPILEKISHFSIIKTSIGAYGSLEYMPDNIVLYWSSNGVDFMQLWEYSIIKTNDILLEYSIISSIKYLYYKLELNNCKITWLTNNCALAEIEFLIDDDEKENIMNKETLDDILLYENIVFFVIWILYFFIWLWKKFDF